MKRTIIFLLFAITVSANPTQLRKVVVGDITENPYTYQVGKLISDPFLVRPKRGQFWTVVNFAPALTPKSYGELYLFCGNQLPKFEGAVDTEVILIYRRGASERDQPTSMPAVCYRLEEVRRIQ